MGTTHGNIFTNMGNKDNEDSLESTEMYFKRT